MKKIIKAACIASAVLLCTAGISGCKDEKGTTKISLSEVTHSVFYAPQYVAINKGFFKDEGIELEVINGAGADKVMAAVVSGQVDIGFAGPEASIYVYNEGKEDYAQVFAQLTQRDGSFLVGREKDDNFDWKKLKGKTLLPGRKGGVPYMTLEYVVKSKGLIPNKDVIFDDSIQFALMTGAFTGGKGDYVTIFEPTASMLEQEGKGYIVASVGKESGEIPYTAYFANKSYIKENEETIQKFVNAIYKGQKWVKEHSSEEIAKVIQPSFPDTDLKLLVTVVNRYKDIDAWSSTPIMKKEAFDKLQKIMTEAGELKQTAPFDKIINNKFAEKAIKE